MTSTSTHPTGRTDQVPLPLWMLDGLAGTDEADIADESVTITDTTDTAEATVVLSHPGPPGKADPFRRDGVRIVPVRQRTITAKPVDDGSTVAVMVDRRRWRRLLYVLVLFAAAYWYFVAASLMIARVVPTLMGWETAAVVSGSMQPVIEPGDVVAYSGYDGGDLRPGAIVAFDDPGRGELVTHRIVGTDGEGRYLTKGDANAANDSTPLDPGRIVGVARLVVPNAGLPTYWMRADQTAAIIGWAVVTIAALIILRLPDPSAPPIVRRVKPNRPRWLQPAITVPAAGIMITLAAVGWTLGTFMDLSGNGANRFQAATVFPPRHVGHLGSVVCAPTDLSIVTLSEPVPAGNTIVVQIATRDGAGTPVSASDSRGNTYQQDANVTGGKLRFAVMSAHVSTALLPGDTVTIDHTGNQKATFVAVEQFAGIADAGRVAAVATDWGKGWGGTVTVAITDPNDTVAAGGMVIDREVPVISPAAWDEIVNAPAACSRDITLVSGAQENTGPTVTAYDPAWSSDLDWAGAVVVYRG